MAKAGPTPGATPPPAPGAPASAPAPQPAVPVAVPASGGVMKTWLPVIVAVLLAPVLTWAIGQYVLIPQLQKKLAATPATEEAAASGAEGKAKEGKDASPNYEFQNIVVNLSGTMGTRYLKTSFLVTGTDPTVRAVFEANKPRLTDVTLNVLSSLSLADLEEPGAKNVLREKLVSAYNQALGRKVADQVYFSDFVVQ